MKWADFLDSVCSLDQYGFQIQPYYHWLPESPEDELKRLEMNQAFYREFMKNGSTFPKEIHQQRQAEFMRIRQIKVVA